MRTAVRRALWVGGATAAALLAWGYGFFVAAWGAGSGSDEALNKWTPFVLGPIYVVYAAVVAGLVWGRWRVWRLIPLGVVLTGAIGLVVQASIEEAGRAYEPEGILWWLYFPAPVVAAAVVLVAEVLARRPPRRAGDY